MSIAAGDTYGEANARITLGSAQASLGHCEEGIANLRKTMDVVRELGAVDLLKRVYANLGSALSGCGDDEGAYEVSLAGARRSREVGARGASTAGSSPRMRPCRPSIWDAGTRRRRSWTRSMRRS